MERDRDLVHDINEAKNNDKISEVGFPFGPGFFFLQMKKLLCSEVRRLASFYFVFSSGEFFSLAFIAMLLFAFCPLSS